MRHSFVALITTVSAIAITQIASAADLPRKAPAAPPPPPPFTWTGFYVGGNVGYSSGNAHTDFNAAPVTVNTTGGPITIPGFAGSQSVKPQGIIGGGQIGYNWQFSPNWVVGLEADIQGSGEKASNNSISGFSLTVPPVSGNAVTDYEAKISWFGTVRGRLGYAWNGVMLYATGGLAYGEVKLDGTRVVNGTAFTAPPEPFSITHAIGHSHVNVGWTVGGGFEGAIFDSRNWTWKLEYLYIDLGSLDDSDAFVQPAITSVTGGQTFTHTHFTDNIVHLGVNYKFH